MNKEEILARGRNENKDVDIMGPQSLGKVGRIAAQVGMLLCCSVAAMEVAVTGQVSMESWLIYFGILSTLSPVKCRLMKKRHELFPSVLYTVLFLMFLVLLLWKLLC